MLALSGVLAAESIGPVLVYLYRILCLKRLALFWVSFASGVGGRALFWVRSRWRGIDSRYCSHFAGSKYGLDDVALANASLILRVSMVVQSRWGGSSFVLGADIAEVVRHSSSILVRSRWGGSSSTVGASPVSSRRVVVRSQCSSDLGVVF